MDTSIESIPEGRDERNAHRFEACSVARAVEVLGDRWTFLILRELFFGVRRFGQLARNLGLSRRILSDRLTKLVTAGVLERRLYRSGPDRYEYCLTPVGLDLYPAIVTLMAWGDRHLSNAAGPPLVLHHRDCGHDTQPVLVCSECREPLEATAVEPRPGPGVGRPPRA
jgi:DNA-binding HxlR family transcriptional regulator